MKPGTVSDCTYRRLVHEVAAVPSLERHRPLTPPGSMPHGSSSHESPHGSPTGRPTGRTGPPRSRVGPASRRGAASTSLRSANARGADATGRRPRRRRRRPACAATAGRTRVVRRGRRAPRCTSITACIALDGMAATRWPSMTAKPTSVVGPIRQRSNDTPRYSSSRTDSRPPSGHGAAGAGTERVDHEHQLVEHVAHHRRRPPSSNARQPAMPSSAAAFGRHRHRRDRCPGPTSQPRRSVPARRAAPCASARRSSRAASASRSTPASRPGCARRDARRSAHRSRPASRRGRPRCAQVDVGAARRDGPAGSSAPTPTLQSSHATRAASARRRRSASGALKPSKRRPLRRWSGDPPLRPGWRATSARARAAPLRRDRSRTCRPSRLEARRQGAEVDADAQATVHDGARRGADVGSRGGSARRCRARGERRARTRSGSVAATNVSSKRATTIGRSPPSPITCSVTSSCVKVRPGRQAARRSVSCSAAA
jgi:hypothetical protein